MPESKRRATSKPGPSADPPACPVAFCPVGMFMTFAGQVRPEVTEHLMAAGRELMLAVTALLDARAETLRREPSRMERIEVEE